MKVEITKLNLGELGTFVLYHAEKTHTLKAAQQFHVGRLLHLASLIKMHARLRANALKVASVMKVTYKMVLETALKMTETNVKKNNRLKCRLTLLPLYHVHQLHVRMAVHAYIC